MRRRSSARALIFRQLQGSRPKEASRRIHRKRIAVFI